MKVKRTVWILSLLLCGLAGPARLPITLANDSARGTGGCVDDTWVATSTLNAPSARQGHTAVWTGTEMIIWGGGDGLVYLNTGSRYDPETDTWTATSLVGAPSARSGHRAVWTGTEMIVWGGVGSGYLNTGGRYDPATDTWTPISTVSAPDPRELHTAVWTGTEMIIWGGSVRFRITFFFNTGGQYDPDTDTWAATSTVGTPSARGSHTAVWTGKEMTVWGGGGGLFYHNTGSRYDPDTDSWVTTSTANAPNARLNHTAVWTGTEMIIWGGLSASSLLNTGGRYDPETDTWMAISTVGGPSARYRHTAVWTDTKMVVWGGQGPGPSGYLNTGGRYDPATDTWMATSLSGAPSARYAHTAVWTGTEMIVWGGSSGGWFNTGGRYCASAGMDKPPR